MTTQIGWPTIKDDFCIKQGAQGSTEVRMTILNDDNTPLPSYTGFQARFSLQTQAGNLVQEFTQANNCLVLATDAVNQLVIVTLLFKPEHTSLYPAGQKLIGDLKLTLPNGVEQQYPYEMTLLVLRSFTQ
jgi:hypothetical protein